MKWRKFGYLNNGEYWCFEISLNDAVDILGVERVYAVIKEHTQAMANESLRLYRDDVDLVFRTFHANIGFSGKYNQGIDAVVKAG